MSTLEVLQQARTLISDPARWTQKTMARDSAGKECYPDETAATCWCAAGALMKIALGYDDRLPAYVTLMPAADFPCVTLTTFNDHHAHAEVLALFDAAIARLESAAAP